LVGRSHPLARALGRVHYDGTVVVDGVAYYGAIFDFQPGRDLTSMAQVGALGRDPVGVATLAADIGSSLAALHAIRPVQLGVPVPGGDRGAEPWAGHIRHWIGVLARMSQSAPPQVSVGGVVSRDVHAVLRHLAKRVDALHAAGFGRFDLALIHNDAHGGNFLGSGGGRVRLTGMVDERLRCGDGLFDLAALTDWAIEVFPWEACGSFTEALVKGYGREDLGGAAMSRLWIYHVERSLGRLAYYLPEPPEERSRLVAAHRPQLSRHLRLLECVVSDEGARAPAVWPWVACRDKEEDGA
jgi:aminoglycoside phosphotransferase (APT) family kinase protein